MDFIVEWLWYLVAFVIGAGVAWLLVRALVKPGSEDEAFADTGRADTTGGRS